MKFKNKEKKRVIVILGPPGSGKGTQGVLLAEKLNAFYFETSALIEKTLFSASKDSFFLINGKKYFLKDQERLWKEGKLWDPEFVIFFVVKKVKELIKKGESIIFSGSPRTLFEAEKLMPLLKKYYGKENIDVILFDLPDKDSIFRNSHRRICQLFRHPILFSKETEHLKRCPLDGSLLMKRALDKSEIIKKRLKEYRERTLPIIDYLKKEGFGVIKIDARPSPSQIFETVLKKLKIK